MFSEQHYFSLKKKVVVKTMLLSTQSSATHQLDGDSETIVDEGLRGILNMKPCFTGAKTQVMSFS